MAAWYKGQVGGGQRLRIRVNSTGVVDGIMEEARVKKEKRHLVMKVIASMENK